MTALRFLFPMVVAAVAGAGVAQAADLPPRTNPYAPPAAYAAPTNWSGFYAGAHLGGGWGESGPVDTSGMLGGLQGGYNFQFNQFVFGGEADITLSGVSNESFTEKTRHDWLGTIRGRAGYSFGNLMAYGTVGFAWSSSKFSSAFGVIDENLSGWAIGAGAEMMIMPNVALRAEYLRYELGNGSFPTAAGPVSIDNSINVIRAGASYKF